MLLQQVHRVGRGIPPPDRLDQLLPSHRPVGVQQEYRQHDALLQGTQRNVDVTTSCTQRPQHIEVDTAPTRLARHRLPPRG
jgi:hypothetical protein